MDCSHWLLLIVYRSNKLHAQQNRRFLHRVRKTRAKKYVKTYDAWPAPKIFLRMAARVSLSRAAASPAFSLIFSRTFSRLCWTESARAAVMTRTTTSFWKSRIVPQ